MWNSWGKLMGFKAHSISSQKDTKEIFFSLMGYAQKENLQHPWSNMATKAQLVVQLCLTFIWMSLEQESNCILISLELENAILLKQMPNVNEILIWVSFAERLLVEIFENGNTAVWKDKRSEVNKTALRILNESKKKWSFMLSSHIYWLVCGVHQVKHD